MDIQNIYEEEKKRNLGLCMSAGIETPNDEDPTRFHQRRHFPNRMTSDIFFSDSPPLENSSRKSNNDFYASAGVDTRYNDQKQSERRHFHASSEDGTMTRDYPDEDKGEQVESFETAEPRKSVGRDDYLSEEMDKHNADQKHEKRHFHLSSEDGTMTRDYPNEDKGEQVESFETAEPRKSVGRGDYLSEELDKHNADQKHFKKRHFHLSTADGTMRSDFTNENEGEQVDSTETPESRKSVGRDDYMSEEMDKHNIVQQQTEKRHFYSEDGKMTSDFANRYEEEKEEVESTGTVESRETEEDDPDHKPTQRRHFRYMMSSNIFFTDLPIENMSLKDSEDPTDFRKKKGNGWSQK